MAEERETEGGARGWAAEEREREGGARVWAAVVRMKWVGKVWEEAGSVLGAVGSEGADA